MILRILLLLSTPWGIFLSGGQTLRDWPSEEKLKAVLSEGESILFTGVLPFSTFFQSGDGASTIESDVPVTFLPSTFSRYTSGFNGTVERDHPINENEFLLVVKSNCSNATVSVVQRSETRLVIQTDTVPATNASFLPVSAFNASWNCSEQGGTGITPDTSNARKLSVSPTLAVSILFALLRSPNLTTAAILVSGILAVSAAVVEQTESPPTPRQLQDEGICMTSVEILFREACLDDLVVESPALREVHIRTVGDAEVRNGTCHATYSNPYTESQASWVQEGNNFYYGLCIVEGRPFYDAKGKLQMAEIVANNESRWSPTSSSQIHTTSKVTSVQRVALGEEWKRRAVGEHASIASFAAFAIALMSNQAPPDLIQDSLTAAMDELQHAQVSFEMASLLTGTTLEPGPLPPTQLEFGKNLTALAIAVAKEGCIDETLSALALAKSVDDLHGDTDELLQLLASKTRQIAKEEGSHAILAWRTIHWVCAIDPDACCVVRKGVMSHKALMQAPGARFGEPEDQILLDQAWRFVVEHLLPMEMDQDQDQIFDGKYQSMFWGNTAVLTLARDIVEGVTTPLRQEK